MEEDETNVPPRYNPGQQHVNRAIHQRTEDSGREESPAEVFSRVQYNNRFSDGFSNTPAMNNSQTGNSMPRLSPLHNYTYMNTIGEAPHHRYGGGPPTPMRSNRYQTNNAMPNYLPVVYPVATDFLFIPNQQSNFGPAPYNFQDFYNPAVFGSSMYNPLIPPPSFRPHMMMAHCALPINTNHLQQPQFPFMRNDNDFHMYNQRDWRYRRDTNIQQESHQQYLNQYARYNIQNSPFQFYANQRGRYSRDENHHVDSNQHVVAERTRYNLDEYQNYNQSSRYHHQEVRKNLFKKSRNISVEQRVYLDQCIRYDSMELYRIKNLIAQAALTPSSTFAAELASIPQVISKPIFHTHQKRELDAIPRGGFKYETLPNKTQYEEYRSRFNSTSSDTATKTASGDLELESDSDESYKSACSVTQVDINLTSDVTVTATDGYDSISYEDDLLYSSALDITPVDNADARITSAVADNYSQTSSDGSFISALNLTRDEIVELNMTSTAAEDYTQQIYDEDDSFVTSFNITPIDVDGIGNASARHLQSGGDESDISSSISIATTVPVDSFSASTVSSLELNSDGNFSDWSDISFNNISNNSTDYATNIVIQRSIVKNFFDHNKLSDQHIPLFLHYDEPYRYTRQELKELGRKELGRVLPSSEAISTELGKIPLIILKEDWRSFRPNLDEMRIPFIISSSLENTQTNTDAPAQFDSHDRFNRGRKDYNEPSIDRRCNERIRRQVPDNFPTHGNGSSAISSADQQDQRPCGGNHNDSHMQRPDHTTLPVGNSTTIATVERNRQQNEGNTSLFYRCETAQWGSGASHNLTPDGTTQQRDQEKANFIRNYNLSSPKQKRPDAASEHNVWNTTEITNYKQSTTLNRDLSINSDEDLNWRLNCATPPIDHQTAPNATVDPNEPRDCDDYSLAYRGIPPTWRHESSTIPGNQPASSDATSQHKHQPTIHIARNCNINQSNWRLDCAPPIPQSQQSALCSTTTHHESNLTNGTSMNDHNTNRAVYQTPQQEEEDPVSWTPPPRKDSSLASSEWHSRGHSSTPKPYDMHRFLNSDLQTPTSRPALELHSDENILTRTSLKPSIRRRDAGPLEHAQCRETSQPLTLGIGSAERRIADERVNRPARIRPQAELVPEVVPKRSKRILGRRVTFNMRCTQIEPTACSFPTIYPTGRNVVVRIGESHMIPKGILKNAKPVEEIQIVNGEPAIRNRPNRLRSDYPAMYNRASQPAGTYKTPKWCEYPRDPIRSREPVAIVTGNYRDMDVGSDPTHDDELLRCNKRSDPCYIHKFTLSDVKKPYPHNKQAVVHVEYKKAPTSARVVATRTPIVVPIDEMRRIGSLEETRERREIFPWDEVIPSDIQRYVVDVSFRGNVPSPLNEQLEDTAYGYIESPHDPAPLKAVVTPYGVVSLFLRDRMRVDITTDFAIRITNPKQNISLALCPQGTSVGLVHPKGRVWQHGAFLEMMINNKESINHYAKSFRDGISFMSDKSPTVYTMTDEGIERGKDWFTDLGFDFIKYVFYHASRHGGSAVISGRATRMLNRSQYFNRHGEDHWVLHKLHIVQYADGNVSVYREQDTYRLVTSPTTGCVSINTPTLKCTGSMGNSQHLAVNVRDQKLLFDGLKTFTLRKGLRYVSYNPDAYFEFQPDPDQRRRRHPKRRN